VGISQSSNDPNSCEALVIEWSNSMESATNHQRECFFTVIFPRCSHPELVSGSVWREGAVRRGRLWVLSQSSNDPNSCEALVIEWSNSMESATNHQREYFSTVIFPRCSQGLLLQGFAFA